MKSTKNILLNLFDSYIFWDIDVEKINIQKEYELIISRVLMFTDSNHFFKNIESLIIKYRWKQHQTSSS